VAITLPPGASVDRDLARRIAEDPNRLPAAAAHWRKRFEELDERVFDTGEFTASELQFAAALPDDELETLAPETKGLIPATESGEVVKRSGCLMSLAEIARHVDPALDPADVGDALGALPTATVPLEDPGLPSLVNTDQVVVAIMLARELFDVMRRFKFCTEHAERYALSPPELLSLYRREGAYAIAPPASSYRYAPVVRTADAGCRTHSVAFFDDTTTRGGFIISHAEASRLRSANTPESRSFGLMFRNAVTIGGLDTIVAPRLPAEDELILFLDSATKAHPIPAPLDALRKNVRERLSRFPVVAASLAERQRSFRSQVEAFDAACLGLMMMRLEELSPADPAPDATTLLARLEADNKALLAAHPAKRESGGRIFITGDDSGTDTKLCLDMQASWYTSRSQMHTLLARRDRGSAPALPRLSPFLTYLRFHIGDPSFVGVLIRALRNLDRMKKEAKKQPWQNADEFLAEAERVAWAPADEKKAKDWLARWAAVGSEFAWRHLGLVERIADAGLRPPWLKTPGAASRRMTETAAVAAALTNLIAERDLLPMLDALLRKSPTTVIAEKFGLLGFASVSARRIALAKVHNFEQLRLVYEAAYEQAGLAPATFAAG
jgi:hypothetical protein